MVSIAFASFPGSGKTTTFGLGLLRRLNEGEIPVGVLALPERSLVIEKAERFRSLQAELSISVEVVEVLGAGTTEGEPLFCSEPRRRRYRGGLGRWACEGCHVFSVCGLEPGRFRHDSKRVREALLAARSGRPVLVVTTHDKLRYLHRDLPNDVVVVVDDIQTPDFCMLPQREFDAEAMVAAADRVDAHLATGDIHAALAALGRNGLIPDLLVARVAASVLGALVEDEPDDALDQAVDNLPTELQQLVCSKNITAPRDPVTGHACWLWEAPSKADGRDLPPGFTRMAIDIARAHLTGHKATANRTANKVRVFIPDLPLIDLARRGRVAWLSVGAMPTALADHFGVCREMMPGDPKMLRTVAARDRTFGVADEDLVEAVVRAVYARIQKDGGISFYGHTYRRPGAIVRKKCHDRIHDLERVRHFGAGHASTDDLADCDLLIVSRFALPPQEITLQARAIARGFNLPQPDQPGACNQRMRGWGGHGPHRKVLERLDGVERHVEEFHTMQSQLNAVGRCRPLSATEPRLVVILAGQPFRGVRVDNVVALEDLSLDLQLDLDLDEVRDQLADAAEARARRQVEQRARVLAAFGELLQQLGRDPSIRDIAEQADVPRSTVHRLLQDRDLGLQLDALRAAPGLSSVPLRRPLFFRGRDGSEPIPVSGSAIAAYANLPLSTTKRHLTAIREAIRSQRPLLPPSRADARRRFDAVLDAIEHLSIIT